MEQLITASIGLLNVNGDYYLQVITIKEDHYFISLLKEDAQNISHLNGLSIAMVDKLPE